MHNETVGKVLRTDKYDKLKFLETNREIKESQVKKIIASIRRVGYVMSPLIVNDKMEIIDGQGRYCALKELGLPVDYVVVPGLGVEECRAMNMNQSNWTTNDFIHSYAAEGNTSYKYLEILTRKYKALPASVVYNSASVISEVKTTALQKGEYVCSEVEYAKADERLTYVSRFFDVAKTLEGKANYFYMALMFAFTHPSVDKDRLEKNVRKYAHKLPSITTMEDALKGVSELYNTYNSQKVYLDSDYKRQRDEAKIDGRNRTKRGTQGNRSLKKKKWQE